MGYCKFPPSISLVSLHVNSHCARAALWQHVPTDQNPTDLVSRGVRVDKLKRSGLWWNGPFWLVEDQQTWPRIDDKIPHVAKECKKATVLASHFTPLKLDDQKEAAETWRLRPSRYSVVDSIGTCSCQSCLNSVQHESYKQEDCSAELLPEEIVDAQEDVIRQARPFLKSTAP